MLMADTDDVPPPPTPPDEPEPPPVKDPPAEPKPPYTVQRSWELGVRLAGWSDPAGLFL